MIDAMKDELNDDDDKDEEQYDQDAKLTHRYYTYVTNH